MSDDTAPEHRFKGVLVDALPEPVPCTGRDEQGKFLAGHRPTGRPRVYGDDVYERILERLRCGDCLEEICEDDGMPDESTARWRLERDESLFPMYLRARQLGLDARLEQGARKAREGVTKAMSKEQVLALKEQLQHDRWISSKLWRERYGDRMDVAHTHTHQHSLDTDSQALLQRVLDRIEGGRQQVIEGTATEVASDDPGE